ncbi:MAG: phosphoribosylanthranilate isomerase [Pseudomonadota bacterium]
MAKTKIKFCGMTQLDDLQAANELEIYAIGLVFYPPSPRVVKIETAKLLSSQCAPFITRVGLFMNQDARTIEQVLQEVDLDMLQFHGQEDEALCQSFGKPYLKSIAMGKGDDLSKAHAYESATALLLDSNELGRPGGSGKVFDWEKIPDQINQPIILAGGLNPENVTEAICKVHPFAVDVSSGIESKKGVKDKNKMKNFVEAVRIADEC